MSSSNSSKKLKTKVGTTLHFLNSSKDLQKNLQSSLEKSVLIYDESLQKIPEIQSVIQLFSNTIAVPQGEPCKSFDVYHKTLETLFQFSQNIGLKELTIVGLGGGSCGDLAGFVASTFKRGVRLQHIPTTWLAALDSSHGGKNAINLSGSKNQVGTFYQPSDVYLVKSLLESLPKERLQDAIGEVIKTGLLSGGALWKKLALNIRKNSLQKNIWSLLPELIKVKYKIVALDPYEKKGIRYILNFGHTFGHAFESRHQWPHGKAVLYGLATAIYFSEQQKICSAQTLKSLQADLQQALPSQQEIAQLLKNTPQILQDLRADKKKEKSDQLQFVFFQRPGKVKVATAKLSDLSSFIP